MKRINLWSRIWEPNFGSVCQRKKAGKFFTEARKLKNNLSPKKLVQKMKKSINKKVLAAKKGIKKVKTTISKAGKPVVKSAKQFMKKKVLNAKNIDLKKVLSSAMYNKKGEPNFLLKSWTSFKEIGTDFVDGMNTRANKAFDSPYHFVNNLTFGISGGIYSGSKSRTSKWSDSPEDFANYMTIGITGMVKGALAPEDAFSKEHWLDSFGMATMLVGGTKGIGSKGSGGTKSKD